MTRTATATARYAGGRCPDHAMAAGHPRGGRQAPPGGEGSGSAERAAADARQRAAALLQPVPAVLLAEPPLPGVDTGPARAAWQRWASPPDAGTAAGRLACVPWPITWTRK